MTKEIPLNDHTPEDEISIADILSKLWRRRGLILSITLLSSSIGLIYILLGATTKKTPVTLFVELSGIKNDTYPNGAAFSPQDLKSPDVLRALYDKYKPKDQNTFPEHLEVNYGSDLMLGTHENYKQQLAQKGLSAGDIQKINSDYKSALEEIAHRGLEIRFYYQEAGLSLAEGKALINEVPRLWNDTYIKNYRVLLDPKLAEIPGKARSISLDTTTGLLEASQYIKNTIAGLKILIGDNRFAALTNADGHTAFDILKRIEFLREVRFLPLMASSLQRQDIASRGYARNIKLQIEEIDRNLDALNALSQETISFQRSNNATSTNQKSSPEGNLQLSDSMLSEILKLSNQASLSDFLKDILTSRRELAFKRSTLQGELDRLTADNNASYDSSYIKEVSALLSEILNEYQLLVEKAKTTASSNIQSFYTPIGTPESFTSKWPDRSLLILSLSILVGLFLSAAIALLLPEKSRPSQ